jgi:hypothetical protein
MDGAILRENAAMQSTERELRIAMRVQIGASPTRHDDGNERMLALPNPHASFCYGPTLATTCYRCHR